MAGMFGFLQQTPQPERKTKSLASSPKNVEGFFGFLQQTPAPERETKSLASFRDSKNVHSAFRPWQTQASAALTTNTRFVTPWYEHNLPESQREKESPSSARPVIASSTEVITPSCTTETSSDRFVDQLIIFLQDPLRPLQPWHAAETQPTAQITPKSNTWTTPPVLTNTPMSAHLTHPTPRKMQQTSPTPPKQVQPRKDTCPEKKPDSPHTLKRSCGGVGPVIHELLLIDALVVLVDEPGFVRNEHNDKSGIDVHDESDEMGGVEIQF